jgi:hypothetical protein
VERLGQNVIFDLATFIGEVVIEKNRGFNWEVYRDVPSGLRKGNPFYQGLAIRCPNLKARWRIWPFDRLHEVCQALRERSFMWQKPTMRLDPPDAMYKPATYIVAQASEWALNLPS